MVEEATPESVRVPVWYWIVAVVATLFNVGGVMNYIVTQVDPQAATAQMTAEQAAYFLNFPTWYVTVYALATHLALAGGILLLLRLGVAFHAFAASALLYGISLVYHYVLNDVVATLPVGMHVFSAVIGIQLVLFAVFARWAKGRRWLR